MKIDLTCQSNTSVCTITDKDDLDIIFMTKYLDFNIEVIKKLDIFKTVFQKFTHIIVLIDDNFDFFKQTIFFLKKHSLEKKIFVCLDTADIAKVKLALSGNTSEIIIKPYDFKVLNNLVLKHIKEANCNKILSSLYSFNTSRLKEFHDSFNSYTSQLSLNKNTVDHFFNKFIVKKDFDEMINNHNLCKLPIDFDNLFQEIKIFYKNIINPSESRYIELKEFTKKLLNTFYLAKADFEIIKPLNKHILSNAVELFSQHDKNDNLYLIFKIKLALEKHIISNFFKLFINENIILKTREIRKNTFHLMMASSSDILKNLTLNISSKDYAVQKLINVISNNCSCERVSKLKENIIKKGEPVIELQNFLEKQSSLFLSYNNFTPQDTTITNLVYFFEYMIINGLKIKHPNVKTHLILDEISNSAVYYIDENILFPSFYEIINNAIEYGASIININFHHKADYLLILFKDNGTGFNIDTSILFNSIISTKGHSGLGLTLIKKWLNSINISIDFNTHENCIEVKIPYINTKD